MRFLLGLLFFVAGLFSFGEEEFYCVQAASSREAGFLEKKADELLNLPDVRVEKIGEFYTLRVGFFRKREEAERILPEVRRLFPDAFVRGCYRIPGRVVYVPGETEEGNIQELLLKAFLGAGRLREARDLLELLTRKRPQDARLWEEYGKVLVWLGESEKALEAFLRAYSLRPSRKLASRILDLALALRRYGVARNFLDKAGAPYEVRVQIYEQLGDVEALKALLKRKKDRKSLLALIRLLFLTGETEEASRYAQEYERLYGVDAEILFLKYEILFAERKFRKALEFLKENYGRFKENKEFLEKLSDLAWSLGDYETSVRASLDLIKLSGGRLLDYDRVSLALYPENPAEALRIAEEGWRRFRSLLLLERTLLYAYNLDLYEKVVNLFYEAGELKGTLLSDPGILYALADSLSRLNRKEEALSLVRKGLEVNPSPEFVVLYASLAWEMGKREALEELLRDFGSLEKDESYRLSFAFLYTLLGKGRKAYRIYRLSPRKDPLLEAEILSLLGKREEANRLRRKRYEELKRVLREDPASPEKRELLIEYLSLAQFFMTEPAYEKLILRLKDYIPPQRWKELYVSFLVNAERRERLRHLVRVKRLTLRPWAEYSLALEDREKLLRLLERKGESLPVKDRLSALVAVGYYERALELAYEILEENDYESNVAFVFGEIFEEWRGLWEAGLSLISREGFGELRGTIGLRAPLRRRYYLRAELEKSTEFRRDGGTVAYAPEAFSLYLGPAFKSANWYYELLGGLYRRLEEKLSFKGLLAGRLGRSLFLSFEGGYNTRSTETLYASLGLLKRFLRFSSSYSFTPKDYLFLSLERASFFVPSGRYVGSGTNFYGEFVKKLRLSYPDYSLRLFFQRGLYEEKEDKGELSIVSPYRDFLVLPEDFTSFGMGLFFGDSYRKSLRYRERPFGGLSWGYSTGIGGIFLGLYGGFSFPLHGGDRLSVVGSFYRNAGGVKENILTLEFFYRRWY
ncbi:MAG: tetratricopeptide repeat protein [Aquificae bacterium]|nr:tetratricopeptide repeat protein [Aquificota bacterium]